MIGKAQRPEEEAETLKMLESHTLRGSPRGKSCSLNIWEVGLKKGLFSAGKFCTCLLVRGTTSFCKGNCNFLSIGESVKWNISMQLNE